jgi:hypothetical protein
MLTSVVIIETRLISMEQNSVVTQGFHPHSSPVLEILCCDFGSGSERFWFRFCSF